MDTIIPTPTIGTIAYFTFKSPFDKVVKNVFNQEADSIKLKVLAVSSMRVPILNYHHDPATATYVSAGLSEVEYKQDLNDDVPLVSFAYIDEYNGERIVEVPLTYIGSISVPSEVPYINRSLVVNLGLLPADLNLEYLYADVVDYIAERTGVSPEVRDVAIGDPTFITFDDHETREEIRKNTAKVKHTLTFQLAQITSDYNELLKRLRELDILLELEPKKEEEP